MRKLSGYVLILLVVFTVIWTGVRVTRHMVRTDPGKARLVRAALPVRVSTAGVETLIEVVGGGGVVEPLSFVKLTTQLTAEIQAVHVDVGALLTPGQVLVEYDTTLLKAEEASAQGQVAQAQMELSNSRQHVQRINALYEARFATQPEWESAGLRLATAKAEQGRALHRLAEVGERLQKAIVRAPEAEVVVERHVNPGEIPQIGKPLLTLGRLNAVLMAANMPEDKTASIWIGQPAEVVLDALRNESRVGKVWKIDPSVDPATRTFHVYIRLNNPDLKLKPGMTGFARIENKRSVLAVPSVAMINPVQDRTVVFVVDKTLSADLRRVRTGLVAGGMTEILNGLQSGDQVVTVGQLYLKDKDKVRIGTETGYN